MKYTEEDIIWKVDDPRLKDAIGKVCYPSYAYGLAVNRANDGSVSSILEEIDKCKEESNPFTVKDDEGFCFNYPFIVLKKNQKKVVPFDFSLMEDRDAVLGKRIYSEKHKDDRIVSKITYLSTHWYADNIYTEELLASYVFADGNNKGKPVGKEIKE